MQRRARHGSSGGELDVFGATRYFADLAAGPVTVREPEDLVIQMKVTHDMKHMEESYRGIRELGLGAKSKSNLATFFDSLVSPAGSFRMNLPASSSTTTTTPGSHDEPPQVSSSSSLRWSSDIFTDAAFVSCDLGEVVGDRRLQGVRVVRGASGGEERWVVRCGGQNLEAEPHVNEKIADAASSDHQAAEELGNGGDYGSDSDTSSDLFELDLQDANNY
jgi:hypothetical protein